MSTRRAKFTKYFFCFNFFFLWMVFARISISDVLTTFIIWCVTCPRTAPMWNESHIFVINFPVCSITITYGTFYSKNFRCFFEKIHKTLTSSWYICSAIREECVYVEGPLVPCNECERHIRRAANSIDNCSCDRCELGITWNYTLWFIKIVTIAHHHSTILINACLSLKCSFHYTFEFRKSSI